MVKDVIALPQPSQQEASSKADDAVKISELAMPPASNPPEGERPFGGLPADERGQFNE